MLLLLENEMSSIVTENYKFCWLNRQMYIYPVNFNLNFSFDITASQINKYKLHVLW